MSNPLFRKIEERTGVKMEDVFKLSNSVQNANFKDEKIVRDLIKKVGQLANKPVKKDTEDQIVKAIVNKPDQVNFNNIAEMINKNKKTQK